MLFLRSENRISLTNKIKKANGVHLNRNFLNPWMSIQSWLLATWHCFLHPTQHFNLGAPILPGYDIAFLRGHFYETQRQSWRNGEFKEIPKKHSLQRYILWPSGAKCVLVRLSPLIQNQINQWSRLLESEPGIGDFKICPGILWYCSHLEVQPNFLHVECVMDSVAHF